MTSKERRLAFFNDPQPETPLCVNCKHFIRYYYMDKAGNFQPLHFGHCTLHARPRKKLAYDACEEFFTQMIKAPGVTDFAEK